MSQHTEEFKTTRRHILAGLGGAALAAAGQSASANPAPNPKQKLRICAFSKHFQWTDWAHTAELAAGIGFDGVDLTVRPGGHVLPERVEQDLPRALDTIRKAGSDVIMITTDIQNAGGATPAILHTAGSLGIQYYRFGGLHYQAGRTIPQQLSEWVPQMKTLAELNEGCGISGMYHTHSGPAAVGGPIWDLWMLFRDLNPRWIGVNYDIGHATVEGGYGGWMASASLVRDYMRGIAIKDFYWDRNEAGQTFKDPYDPAHAVKGAWVPHWCALGQGMVNVQSFLEMEKAAKFSGPVQLHFEYPGLGGANNGNKKITITETELVGAMRRDLGLLRKMIQTANLDV